MKAVYKKELKAYFQSIIGCVFIAFLIAFTGIYFMAYNMTTGYPYFSFRIVDRIYCRDSFDYDAFICRREKE
jgi:tellurite resistance protein TehA-like permease